MTNARLMSNTIVLCALVSAFWALKLAYDNYYNPKVRKPDKILAGPARKSMPLVSIRSRIPQGKPISPTMPIQKESDQLWKSVDLNIRTDSAVRTYYLRKLHEDTKSIFLESAEAGAARVLELPFVNHASEVYLDDSSSQPVKQPGSSANFGKSANEQFVLVQPQEPFFDIHFRSIFRFIFPKGLGYVRDLDHVAGFVSHGFREKMRSDLVNNREQRIDHVELIGILTQPEPIVYMTDKMPSMEQIKKGTTRKLDAFEEKGLHELFKGEDFFIAQKDNTVRMLGALRATQTCIQCHDTANEYDLLGAFSYTLRTNAAVTQPAPKQPTN